MPPLNKRISTSRRDVLGFFVMICYFAKDLITFSQPFSQEKKKKKNLSLLCSCPREWQFSRARCHPPIKYQSDTSLPVGKQSLLCRNSLCWGLAGACHLLGRKESHGDLKQSLKSYDTKTPNPHGRPRAEVTELIRLNGGVALSPQHVHLIQQRQQELVQTQQWNLKAQTGCGAERPLPWEPSRPSSMAGPGHRTCSDNSDTGLLRVQKLRLPPASTAVSRDLDDPLRKLANFSLAYPREGRHRIRNQDKENGPESMFCDEVHTSSL